MSKLDLVDGVLYPIGGFARVIESIADLAVAEGVTIVRSARVSRIRVEDGVATGVDYLDREGHTHAVLADLVVSAADLHHTETRAARARPADLPAGVLGCGRPRVRVPCCSTSVFGASCRNSSTTRSCSRDDWRGGFEAIFGPSPRATAPASLYVCKPRRGRRHRRPRGPRDLFVLVPLPAEPSLGKGGIAGTGDDAIEALADTVIRQIGTWTGIGDLAARITVRRTVGPGDFAAELNAWRGTALGPAHILRQSALFRAGNVSEKVRKPLLRRRLHHPGGRAADVPDQRGGAAQAHRRRHVDRPPAGAPAARVGA
ncbi:MAG: hypothetical protein WDM88_07035 [Galbitalea sp.]